MTTPDPITPVPRKGTPRWLWALLVGSLALNLLIVGAVAGHRFGGRRWHGAEFAGAERYLLRELASDRREALKGLVEDVVAAGRDVRKDLRLGRRAAAEAFAAEPFDRAKFEAAVQSMLDGQTLTRTGLVVKMGTLAEALTPEERARLAKHLRFLRHGPGDEE